MRTWINSGLAVCLAGAVGLSGCAAELGSGGSRDDSPTSGEADGDGRVGPDGEERVVLSGGLELEGKPKYYRVVRLNHEQWENAVVETLGLSARTGESSGFLPDPPNGKFSNNERALYVTDTLWQDYQRASEAVAALAAGDSAVTSSWGSEPRRAIETVGRRAFRRALTQEEVDQFETLWVQGPGLLQSGNDFVDGSQIFVEALLQSPHFIYRVQVSPEGERLSGTELATRLSLLLRNSPPTEELLTAAEAGALDMDEGLVDAASQMLSEQPANGAMDLFHSELFGLFRYASILKDRTTFPEYTDDMNGELQAADEMFFSHVFASGGGVRDMLTSTIGYINDTIAPIYGLTASGSDLVQADLGPARPGFFTRAGFLAYNANLTQPDPIHRGVDINNKLLCAELAPPPGEIPALPPPEPGQTNRQRVIAHTEVGVCKNCHGDIINPPGFALESFDAMGRSRTEDNGNSLDTSGNYGLLDGEQSFEDYNALAELLANSRRVHSCYSAHVSEFSLGRDVGTGETDLLEAMGEGSSSTDWSMKDLLLSVVTSPRFTTAISGTP